jgi:nitrobindin-like protein
MPIRIVLSIVLLFPSLVIAQNPQQEVWEPLKFFVGSWEGTGKGQPGVSKTEREYRFVLNGKFLHVRNRSVYEPQAKSPKGEIHEDWGLLSFDKGRKQFVLRQFHGEGFVNHYVQSSFAPDGKSFTLTTEHIENIPAGWRARETYRIVSPDEFVEVFELAEPGKDFEIYTESRYKRRK